MELSRVQELIKGLPIWCLWLNGQDLWCEVTTVLCSFVTLKKKYLNTIQNQNNTFSPNLPQAVNFQWVSFASMSLFLIFFMNIYALRMCTFVLLPLCELTCVCLVHIYLCKHACECLRLMLESSSIPPPHYSLRQGLSIKPDMASLFWRSQSAFQGLNYKWAATSTLSSQSSLVLSWSSYVGGTQQPFITGLCHEWFMTVKNLCNSWYIFCFTYHSAFTTAHNYF